MAVAIVADAHLGGPGGAAEPLVEQLAELDVARCSLLLFLGDLFHVWVGHRRFETPEIRLVIAAIERLRDRGLRVCYVEGNRDFFLASSCYAGLFERVATEVDFEDRGVRYVAVHGDGLNDGDWRYRFWRWLSKSLASRILSPRIPAVLAQRIVGGTERRLARTNFHHRKALPERAIANYGRRRLAEGYDVLLLGHFHEERSYRLDDGEVRLLDAWFNTREILWLDR